MSFILAISFDNYNYKNKLYYNLERLMLLLLHYNSPNG